MLIDTFFAYDLVVVAVCSALPSAWGICCVRQAYSEQLAETCVRTTWPQDFARAVKIHMLAILKRLARNGALYVASKAHLLGMDL
jgi:hypothetical protein